MRRALLPLLLLAACDDGGGAIVDASAIDAPLNDCGCTFDSSNPLVRVHVASNGGPMSDVPVYFLDNAGALIAMTPTGADGIAGAPMPNGGSVTALVPDGARPRLATALAVHGGDVINVQARGGGALMLVDLTFPADGSNGHYAITSPCGSADIVTDAGPTVTTQVQLYDCGPETAFQISADNGDGGPVSTLFDAHVAVSDQAAVTITGSYTAALDVTHGYTNLPAGLSFITGGRAVVSLLGLVTSQRVGLDVVGGAATTTLQVPDVPATGLLLIATTEANRGGFSQSLVLDGQGATDYTLDATDVFLPTFTAPATFDIATQRLAWTEDGTGATPDLTFAALQINRPSLKASWSWDVVAPHGTTAFTLPALPGVDADLNPTTDDQVFVNEHLTARVPGGYDVGRQVALAMSSPEQLARSFTGRLVIERQLILTARKSAVRAR